LENNYNCDCAQEPVAYGALSTEHSVMCSNFSMDGDEITHIRRLLTEIYPHKNFSMVSDSYDYWNLVDNLLPQLKDEILAHDGCLLIRGDSGDPVEVVTKTAFKLWDIFGGTVNSKGFKVLNPHVKALYGDSITPQRCRQIYQILESNGFAINNVSLGVGSFSMQCLETLDGDEKQYAPYTRDTFGIAVKATYAEDADGNPIMIFKNPKTDTGHFKKSQRGCCRVVKDGDNYTYEDGLTWAEAQENNELQVVFKNGEFIKTYSLSEVRQNLHGGRF
jgi:nicotinamide phosphoribosyltransferase